MAPAQTGGLRAVYTEAMSTEVKRKGMAMRRALARRNSMAFPRELRNAIPLLHDGRVLELDSISGQASNGPLFGPLVELKLVVKETGKRSDSFVVVMRLQPEAARRLGVTLKELADRVGREGKG